MKILIPLLLILLLSCGKEIDNISSGTYKAPIPDGAIAVETLTVSKGKFLPYIETSGTIKGIEEAWAVSETQGIITEAYLTLGQEVSRGDVIVKINSDTEKLSLDLAKHNLESAQLDYNGNRALFNNGNISESQFNQYKYTLLQAKNQYKTALKQLNLTAIKVPIDGSIAILNSSLSVGNYIQIGTRVARIVNNSSYKMELYLGDIQVSSIDIGANTTIHIDNGLSYMEFHGEVKAIGSGSDPDTGSFPVLIEWHTEENKPKLRSGISAQVKIETREDLSRIIVPDSSIMSINNRDYIFINKAGVARRKEVEPGNSFAGNTVIHSGIELEDEVLISSIYLLEDGDRIIPTNLGKSGDWK